MRSISPMCCQQFVQHCAYIIRTREYLLMKNPVFYLQIWIRSCVHLLLFITLGVHSSKFDVNPVTDDISRLSVLVRTPLLVAVFSESHFYRLVPTFACFMFWGCFFSVLKYRVCRVGFIHSTLCIRSKFTLFDLLLTSINKCGKPSKVNMS